MMRPGRSGRYCPISITFQPPHREGALGVESPPFTGDHGASDEAPDSSISPSSDTPPGIPAAPSAPRGRLQLEILWQSLISTVNEQAQISADVAERNDCLACPPAGAARLAVWAGGDEPGGWIDQSRQYADLARTQGLDCAFFELAGTDHFTVLERSFETDSTGWQAIFGLLGE